jgi:muramoyltetrapeptide carboxypeptidase LdcA involved in peptidoglycan recycling
VGGCLESICRNLVDSEAWIEPSGMVPFLETSEEMPSHEDLERYLTSLAERGVFEEAAGLVLGRAYGFGADRSRELWEAVAVRTEASATPILANVDLGHTDPMLTLPLGLPARLDATAKRFEMLEPATED